MNKKGENDGAGEGVHILSCSVHESLVWCSTQCGEKLRCLQGEAEPTSHRTRHMQIRGNGARATACK